MYPISDRCRALREEAMNTRTYHHLYCCQRNALLLAGIARAQKAGKSRIEAYAEGIAYVIEHFTPIIEPGERIVGFHFGWQEHFYPDDSEEGRRILRENGISDEDAEIYLSRRGDPFAGFEAAPAPTLTKEEWESQKEMAGIGRCIDSDHTVIGYEQVLRLGFSGLGERVRQFAEQNGDSPFYRALARLCEAIPRLGEKYAALASRLLQEGHPDYDPDDLRFIIKTCQASPGLPATGLATAIQSLWFSHIINCWEDSINANSLGRLDQLFYPYYKADLEDGLITEEEAFELICLLWIKLYRDYDVQQSCVGGRNADGSSAVNPLSYLMLDATEGLGFIRCMSVRFDPDTDPAFLRRALEVVGRVGKGVPFFFNDAVMIPALVQGGISYEDACDYTQIGCVETVIPGKSNPHAVTGQTNLLKAMEYVLSNGYSMMYPDMKPGVETGELSEFDTYDSFYRALLTQIDRILDLTCSKVRKYRDASAVNSPRPFKSLLTEGCLERGLDFNDAGARYDYYQIMLGGVPNLADSLAVIKKFVYDEKKYTLAQIKQILIDNFPDEAVRTEFIKRAPKFGNDLPEVDQIAADLVSHSCDTLKRLESVYHLLFHAQPFTYLWMVDHGHTSAASPDGRRKGEIIAYSVSPMQGRDENGLTALFNSLSAFDTKRTPGTTSAIVEVDPKLFSEQNTPLLADILLSSAAKGLSNVQFNTVSVETLIDAQKHPEHYNNLAVRVSGFSQKFNLLSKPLQDHIIGRTKHQCL